MSLSSDDAQKLVQFLQFLDQNKDLMVGYNTKIPVETYLMIGSLTVLVFDYLITFDREVNYVWSSPWSLGLPLFYINRYVPFVDLALFINIQFSYLTNERCRQHISAATWLVSVPSFFGQMIIVLRTCALWQNNQWIVSFLLFVLCATLVVTSFFTAKVLALMTFAPKPSFLKGCYVFQDSKTSLYIYIPVFVCELIIIMLTVMKAAQHLRQNRTAWLSQLYRNGIFYCICILALSLSNIIVPLTKLPYVYKQCLRLPQHVFHSMFCNRVVFQLFEYRYHTAHSGRYHASTTLSGPDLSTEQYASTDNRVSSSVFFDNITAKTDDIELNTLPSSRATTSADRDHWIT